ncbi:MAG: hypothetical protein ACTS73_04845 [Arsenophonus sp. NEOnobi-MAG3]
MNDEIFEECNAECVNRFFEVIINKKFIPCSDGELNNRKPLPASMKLVIIT